MMILRIMMSVSLVTKAAAFVAPNKPKGGTIAQRPLSRHSPETLFSREPKSLTVRSAAPIYALGIRDRGGLDAALRRVPFAAWFLCAAFVTKPLVEAWAGLAIGELVILLDKYQALVQTKPIFYKACTAGVAFMLGDLITQFFHLRKGKRDKTVEQYRPNLARSARSGVAGFVGHGPITHFWILYMEVIIV